MRTSPLSHGRLYTVRFDGYTPSGSFSILHRPQKRSSCRSAEQKYGRGVLRVMRKLVCRRRRNQSTGRGEALAERLRMLHTHVLYPPWLKTHTLRLFVKRYRRAKRKRLNGERFRITVEPVIVKKYRKTGTFAKRNRTPTAIQLYQNWCPVMVGMEGLEPTTSSM